jgi:glutathione S-transferase
MLSAIGGVQKGLGVIFNIPFLGNIFDLFTLLLQAVVRFDSGGRIAGNLDKCKRPEKPLIIYEYEGCPFCRKVREATSVLGLDVIVKPCPRPTFKKYQSTDGSRYRPEAMKIGGKAMFPFLVDENTNTTLYESSDIVEYLFKEYGSKAELPLTYRIATSAVLQWTVVLASAFRPLNHCGLLRQPSRKPKQRLVLWGFEGSPFVARVREALCVLELEYEYKYCPKFHSESRKEFYRKHGNLLSTWRKKAGLIQVPLLEDPNTGVVMLESADIVEYLMKTYGTGEASKESLADYTTEGATSGHGKIPFSK